MQKTYKIQDLEQVRLLADPMKLEIIRSMAEGPKTTRQVAEELDESLTKLYRHVDALLDAGLIEIVEERQKRGTVERTFQAVARRFEADHALFSAGDTQIESVRELIRGGEDELLSALAHADDSNQPLFARVRVKGSKAAIARLQDSLEEWLESAQDVDDEENSDEIVEAGVMLAFYPTKDSQT